MSLRYQACPVCGQHHETSACAMKGHQTPAPVAPDVPKDAEARAISAFNLKAADLCMPFRIRDDDDKEALRAALSAALSQGGGGEMPSLADAVAVLGKALRDDPAYYQSWQANIAMAFKDSQRSAECQRDIHEWANEAADRFLTLLMKPPAQVEGVHS